MDATYVKQQLQQLGYQDVDKVQHLGGIFDVLASQDGKPVDLRIDSRTGRIFNLSSARSIMPHPGMTPGYVRQQLADRGYTDLSGVHRIGDTWRAAAMLDGQPVQLRIDSNSGLIANASQRRLSVPTGVRMTVAYVKSQLLALGYQDIAHVDQVGGLFRAKAMQQGKPVDLRVDVNTGRITHLPS